MQNRNIALCVVLSIITCGIYLIYWEYTELQAFEDAKCPSRPETTPGVTILLSIVTCGIYGIYAFYKMGRATPELYIAYGQQPKSSSDAGVMYLILSLFGFSIVNMCLIQNDINTIGGPVYYDQNYQHPGYTPPPTDPYTQPQPPQGQPYDPNQYTQPTPPPAPEMNVQYPYPPGATYPSPFDANAPEAPAPAVDDFLDADDPK